VAHANDDPLCAYHDRGDLTMIDPVTEEKLRQGFKVLNRFMLLMFRLGLGIWFNIWPQVSGRVLVITHTGRKSGLRRRTPVNYAEVDGELYCVAGFGSISDWYRNIKANPSIEVWLPDGWWSGIAEEMIDPKLRGPLMRQVLIGSGFAARVFGIDPKTLSDEELESITAKYQLIHLKRLAPCTGANGPGDLAWVWPLATFILLPIVLLRRRRH
jgi:deazaflavin-dependent oxidoreductase (nitroreductase family)